MNKNDLDHQVLTKRLHSRKEIYSVRRLKVLLAFFMLASCNVFGQDVLQGKWYMLSRNRVIEFNFSNDSLITKQLHWDLSNVSRNSQDTQIVETITSLNGKLYLSLKKPKNKTGAILINILKVIRPDREMLFALNGPDTPFKTQHQRIDIFRVIRFKSTV